ncbi:twin-arginine translocase subunit TatC [Brevibacillus sp. SYSU BS000544]|uniref:twin-arginine translocase subunit TatC n=1 Tax=Brevibacillus sp. SYSU BS000544 TaxID=3416443 RepID=UPI003CE4CA52
MSLVNHLGELRKRLIRIGIVLVLSMIISLYYTPGFLSLLQGTAPIKVVWNVFSPGDVLSIYMQLSFSLGLIITAPYVMYQLWAFVKPGLKKSEQKAALKYVPFSACMFAIGMLFGYFVVFRMVLLFTNSLNMHMEIQQMYGLDKYISFLLGIVIPVAGVFELPVVVMFLTVIHILHPDILRKYRKYAYFLLFIVSAMITPPDVISDLIVCIPLVLLYELSIFLSNLVIRKQEIYQRTIEIA